MCDAVQACQSASAIWHDQRFSGEPQLEDVLALAISFHGNEPQLAVRLETCSFRACRVGEFSSKKEGAFVKSLTVLFVVFLAFVSFARPASAQAQNLDVKVTVLGHAGVVSGSPSDHFLSFSGPVGIPGVSLAPGSYIFRFVERDIVKVLSEDRSTAYGMFFVTPTWRNEPTRDYAVTLSHIVPDAPPRLTTMFPPASSTGYELRY